MKARAYLHETSDEATNNLAVFLRLIVVTTLVCLVGIIMTLHWG